MNTPTRATPAPAFQRRQYWNEPAMNGWEKFYLFEIARGLSITGGVFLRNMWKWITGRKGALTAYYPEEMRTDYAKHNRGRHVLVQRDDGSPQCVACNLCATVCPARCIEIDAAFDPADAAHPKSPATFTIDYSRCIFCGMCVEACPEDAIRMAPWTPSLPGYDRDGMWQSRETLMSWYPQRDAAKPYPARGASQADAA